MEKEDNEEKGGRLRRKRMEKRRRDAVLFLILQASLLWCWSSSQGKFLSQTHCWGGFKETCLKCAGKKTLLTAPLRCKGGGGGECVESDDIN